MAENDPALRHLIILGSSRTCRSGGLFMAGIARQFRDLAWPSIVTVIVHRQGDLDAGDASGTGTPAQSGHGERGIAAFASSRLIFGGFRSGFATATEDFGLRRRPYALLVASALFREMTWRGAGDVIRNAVVKSAWCC